MSNISSTLASAGVSAGAGLLGSAIGSIGGIFSNRTNLKIARETNAMNYKIAQEANAANYKLWQAQNQANIDMWNMENEYNSATNQRQRLEDAGLNPYLMMSGGNAGTAGSISSASASPYVTPQMQSATVQNPIVTSPFDQAMQNVSLMLYNRSLQKEQIRSQQLDNDMKEIDLQFKPLMALYEKNSKKYQSFIDNVTFDFLSDTLQDRKDSVKYRTATDYQDYLLREEQVIGAQLDNTTKGLLNYFLPQEKLQGLMQGVAQIQATETSIKKMNAEIRNLVAIAFGNEVDAGVKDKTSEGLIKAINAKSAYESSLYGDETEGFSLADIQRGNSYLDLVGKDKDLTKPNSTKFKYKITLPGAAGKLFPIDAEVEQPWYYAPYGNGSSNKPTSFYERLKGKSKK